MIKGIIFLLIFGLFVSRLIPKYLEFRETNIVNLLGVDWVGSTAALILLAVLVLGVIVLAIAMQSFYQFFTDKTS
ncbi:MAG: hypothetical protein GKR92_04275 [Gammaproteobacteria bacterium]|nr:MAG: hypothetical protein GKR92_04275 [Gammaproteobacteria bacterium]